MALRFVGAFEEVASPLIMTFVIEDYKLKMEIWKHTMKATLLLMLCNSTQERMPKQTANMSYIFNLLYARSEVEIALRTQSETIGDNSECCSTFQDHKVNFK